MTIDAISEENSHAAYEAHSHTINTAAYDPDTTASEVGSRMEMLPDLLQHLKECVESTAADCFRLSLQPLKICAILRKLDGEAGAQL